MAQYYRIKIQENGKAYLIDNDGNKIPPSQHIHIAESVIETATTPFYVYVGYNKLKALWKIGVSNDPSRRAKEVGIDYMLTTIECDAWGDCSAWELEKLLHNLFKALQQHEEGEWFDLDYIDIMFLRWCYKMSSKMESDDFFEEIESIYGRCMEALENSYYIFSPLDVIGKLSNINDPRATPSLVDCLVFKAVAVSYAQFGETLICLIIYEVVITGTVKRFYKEYPISQCLRHVFGLTSVEELWSLLQTVK